MPLPFKWPWVLLIALFSSPLWAAKKVDLDYHVRFLPQTHQAEVRLTSARPPWRVR